MVLVHLQAEFGNGKMYESVVVRFQTDPLRQDVEGSYCESQSSTEIVPSTMHHFLEVTDQGEHGKDRLHHHAFVPLPTITHFEIGRVAFAGMETLITQYHHLVLESFYQMLEMGIVNVSSVAVPCRHQPQMVEHQTQLASHDPSVVGLALLAYLMGSSSLP